MRDGEGYIHRARECWGVKVVVVNYKRRSWTVVSVIPQTKVTDTCACSECERGCVIEMLMERIMIQSIPRCHCKAPPHTGALQLCRSPPLSDTQKSEAIIICRVNRTPSISLWCDCRELLLFAGVQLTRLLACAFRPPIYISGQR